MIMTCKKLIFYNIYIYILLDKKHTKACTNIETYDKDTETIVTTKLHKGH
jgi:hypothetical protein